MTFNPFDPLGDMERLEAERLAKKMTPEQMEDYNRAVYQVYAAMLVVVVVLVVLVAPILCGLLLLFRWFWRIGFFPYYAWIILVPAFIIIYFFIRWARKRWQQIGR